MSKATSTSATSHRSSAAKGRGKPGRVAPKRTSPQEPATTMSTQDLIARIWQTLEWHKTLQIAAAVTIVGVVTTLLLAGLALLMHEMTSCAVAWPAGVSVATVTVTYVAARRGSSR